MVSKCFGTESELFDLFGEPLADFNHNLEEYALKQDMRKNFTQYKEQADRKERFRQVYLKLIKEGKVLTFVLCILT